jgi:hypothetical protein
MHGETRDPIPAASSREGAAEPAARVVLYRIARKLLLLPDYYCCPIIIPMFSMLSHRKTVFVTKTLFAHPKNIF